MTPSQPPINDFRQRHQKSEKPAVQLSLKDAIKLPGDSNQVRKQGASLVTMLLR